MRIEGRSRVSFAASHFESRTSHLPRSFIGNEVCFGHWSQACTVHAYRADYWRTLALLCRLGALHGALVCGFNLVSTKTEIVWVALVVHSSTRHQTPIHTRLKKLLPAHYITSVGVPIRSRSKELVPDCRIFNWCLWVKLVFAGMSKTSVGLNGKRCHLLCSLELFLVWQLSAKNWLATEILLFSLPAEKRN